MFNYCSQVHTTCMPPYPWPETFNTTYDCMTFGYQESLNKMEEIGREDVNKHGVYIRFTCTPEETICCLLYTSPSPRDGLLSRMPSSA